MVYVSYLAFCPHARKPAKCIVNQKVKKNEAKVRIEKLKTLIHFYPSLKSTIFQVVDLMDIEDISEKAAFCRCWKSKNFPYCDGAHTAHNQETGDNVGPVVLSRKQK